MFQSRYLKAREKYEQLERFTLPYEDGDVTADNAAVFQKLLQLANGAVYDENGAVKEIHSAKLEALDDIIEAATGRPVLVFYAYRHDSYFKSAYRSESDRKALRIGTEDDTQPGASSLSRSYLNLQAG